MKIPHQLLMDIKELYRQRNDLLRPEGNLTRQLKSIFRRRSGAQHPTEGLSDGERKKALAAIRQEADGMFAALRKSDGETENFLLTGAVAPLYQSWRNLRTERLYAEKRLLGLAQQLPLHDFVAGIHGFGWLSLAQIVGETGDLNNYSGPAKIWKRMGLAVIDGEGQRRCKNKKKALEHGFCPRRRAVMSVIGVNLVMVGKNRYRELYLERKAFEAAKIPDTEKSKKIHCHKRALKYMEKRLLVDLFNAWKAAPDPELKQAA